MIKLYHCHQARSTRTRWLLEELGLPYELVKMRLSDADLKTPDYLQIHPLGKVPAIEDDGVVLFESGAITEYLVETYGNGKLAPPPGSPRRAKYLQWLHFAEATTMVPLSDIFQHTLLRKPDKRIAQIADEGREKARKALDVLEKELEGKDYILGSEFSAVDTMVGYAVIGAKMLGLIGKDLPNLSAYVARLAARPAYQKATAV